MDGWMEAPKHLNDSKSKQNSSTLPQISSSFRAPYLQLMNSSSPKWDRLKFWKPSWTPSSALLQGFSKSCPSQSRMPHTPYSLLLVITTCLFYPWTNWLPTLPCTKSSLEFSLSCPSYITSVPTFLPPWSPQRVWIIRSPAFTSITSLNEHRLLYRYISCMYLRPAHRIFS